MIIKNQLFLSLFFNDLVCYRGLYDYMDCNTATSNTKNSKHIWKLYLNLETISKNKSKF